MKKKAKVVSKKKQVKTIKAEKEVVAPSLYNMDLYQALREVIENDAVVKGEKFSEGIYLRKFSDTVYMMNINSLTTGQRFFIVSKGYANQKYRIVKSLSKKGLVS